MITTTYLKITSLSVYSLSTPTAYLRLYCHTLDHHIQVYIVTTLSGSSSSTTVHANHITARADAACYDVMQDWYGGCIDWHG